MPLTLLWLELTVPRAGREADRARADALRNRIGTHRCNSPRLKLTAAH